jgi:hypothetical protein
VTTGLLWNNVLQKYVADIKDPAKPKDHQWGWVNITNPNAPLIISDADELIGAIHNAGGIAVFAHPRWYPEIVFPNGRWEGDGYGVIAQYIRELKTKGVDALEVYTHWLDKQKDAYYLSLTEELGLPVSCGTDCHYSGKENLALGIDGNFYMPYTAVLRLFDKPAAINFLSSGKTFSRASSAVECRALIRFNDLNRLREFLDKIILQISGYVLAFDIDNTINIKGMLLYAE